MLGSVQHFILVFLKDEMLFCRTSSAIFAYLCLTSTKLSKLSNYCWLVVWNGLDHFLFFHILGMSSSPLTNSMIFQRVGLNHQPAK